MSKEEKIMEHQHFLVTATLQKMFFSVTIWFI